MDVPANVQQLSGHVRNWLTRNGFPVRDFRVVPRAQHVRGDSHSADGLATPGFVSFSDGFMPNVQRAADRYGQRGRVGNGVYAGVKTLMHEGLHQMQFGRNPDLYNAASVGGETGGYWEEAATEAATNDLLGIFMRKMYGDGRGHFRARNAVIDQSNNGYGDREKTLRQLSTFGSGATSYNKRPARVWRRTFLHADQATRDKMIQDATARRIEWGARAGR